MQTQISMEMKGEFPISTADAAFLLRVSTQTALRRIKTLRDALEIPSEKIVTVATFCNYYGLNLSTSITLLKL